MSILSVIRKIVRPSFVGTFSDDAYKKVGPMTAPKQLDFRQKQFEELQHGMEHGYGKVSHGMFLFTIANFKTSPSTIYRKYRRIRKQMKFMLIVVGIMFLLAMNQFIDYLLGLSNIISCILFALCFLFSLVHYANHAHKAKQIAIGCIFPPIYMFHPSNHFDFENYLYDLKGKKIRQRIIITNEMYKEAVHAIAQNVND
ncbi:MULTISPECIES: hypothetical protein [Vibrio harveyi group]|uniref:hypothetical protein n=1 Tax=Vibrio harveyi group TaxID=717610 RepID=UPI0015937417|nr:MULTISPECIES: hypothetical protein [Vibrio harveyi group]MBO0179731.1 hypothetical protein [Vibrio parahaemolyticus]MDF5359950.1 hypothetical protein [Vibrio parahaemolyticus]MDG2754365.1 hypothetical protein [Vibrio parahaemolyticus]MDG2763766.1 hypothetical protein [Vibrio parahaemolyticus]QKS98413.1 hypothetical protein HUO05_24735 [Vibrio alginolyticus]